jgi:fructoselysine and glucoselysine-specific PTS system IID component
MSKEEKAQLNTLFYRNFSTMFNYNQVRQMGHGAAWTLKKYIEWLYPGEENKEQRVEAMQRESVFWNVTPYINSIVIGFLAAMEKEGKENPQFDKGIINKIKTATMGPLAGIGDSIYEAGWRVLASTLALPFAMKGSILGIIIYIVSLYVPATIVFHKLLHYSYKTGTEVFNKILSGNLLKLITRAASIVGMVMVGGLIASNVNVPIGLQIAASEDQVLVIQNILDSIAPGLLGLLLTFLMFYLIRKKKNPSMLMLAIFVVVILGTLIGIF